MQDDKLQKAKTLGATHTINARNEDAVKKIKVLASPFSHILDDVKHKLTSKRATLERYI